jgi:hypothetical protein
VKHNTHLFPVIEKLLASAKLNRESNKFVVFVNLTFFLFAFYFIPSSLNTAFITTFQIFYGGDLAAP